MVHRRRARRHPSSGGRIWLLLCSLSVLVPMLVFDRANGHLPMRALAGGFVVAAVVGILLKSTLVPSTRGASARPRPGAPRPARSTASSCPNRYRPEIVVLIAPDVREDHPVQEIVTSRSTGSVPRSDLA